MRSDPDVIGRDWPSLLSQVGRDAAKKISRVPGNWQDADVGIFEELCKHSDVRLIAGAVSETVQQLSGDNRREEHLLRVLHKLGNSLVITPQGGVGVRVEEDLHCQKDSSTCSKTSTALRNSASSSAV